MQIEVDFDVFKALTARRSHEGHSYNAVLRELLGLPMSESEVHPDSAGAKLARASQILAKSWTGPPAGLGFQARDLFLPEGTVMRSSYKGELHLARIFRGKWCHPDGSTFDSPSAAATAITGTNVNGLRFWEALRPNDTEYRKLELIREMSL
jgi:hypothetical protein